jgi:HemK-related putative methylase
VVDCAFAQYVMLSVASLRAKLKHRSLCATGCADYSRSFDYAASLTLRFSRFAQDVVRRRLVSAASIVNAMNAITRLLIRASLPIRRSILRQRLGRLVLEEIDGVPLLVLPEVFNPVIFRSSALLARTVASDPFVRSGPELSVLDMGTGSGVGALFAAKAGCRVTAVDINPEAVRCARINALVNRLEDRIDVYQGDLFDPIAGHRFDLVLFNPPYFRGAPRSLLDAAWRGEDVLERFADGLGSVLSPDGRALIVLSTDGERDALLKRLGENGFDLSTAARKDLGNEVLTVCCVQAPPSQPVQEVEALLRSFARQGHPQDES